MDTFIDFIKQEYDWDPVILTNTKLVIDGSALCLSLYTAFFRHTWYYGGDYHEYYNCVRTFFDKLKNSNIEAYVVMSGIYVHEARNVQNIPLHLEEKNKIIADLPITPQNLTPLFVVHVFLDALREKGIKFFVSDCGVAREIASLANYFHCPVFGKNSTFYLYKLEGGFIPMTPDSRRNLTNGTPVNTFKYQNFNQQFSLHDDDLMLCVPLFLEKDFRVEMPEAREVITYIQNFRSFNDIVRNLERQQRKSIIKRHQNAKQLYTVQPASLEQLEKCKKQLKHPMPSWVVTAYKRGEIQKDLMIFLMHKVWKYKRLVEDMQQKSAWEFTRKIREVIMAILTPQDCSSLNDDAAISFEDDSTSEDDSTIDSKTDSQDSSLSDDNSESEPETEEEPDTEEESDDLFWNDALWNVDSESKQSDDTFSWISSGSDPESEEICETQVFERVRVSGQPTIKNKLVEIKRGPIHNLIDYTLTWKKPESRRRALLVITDCCEIKDRLETIPEGLQLAVIATHYWIKKKREYRTLYYLRALVSCIVTCYYRRTRVRPRLQITSAELRPLAHVFAHWQCTLHDLIALNQVLNQPYRYTSPAHLFSGTILHYFLESRNMIRDRRVTELLDVIMHRV